MLLFSTGLPRSKRAATDTHAIIYVALALAVADFGTVQVRAQTRLFDLPTEAGAQRLRPRFVGDVNGDGYADWAQEYLDGRQQGLVSGLWVFSGRDGRVLYDCLPDLPGREFGSDAVAGVGDVDGDGHPDILVGCFRSPVAFPEGGAAYLWSGRTGRKIYRIDGRKPRDFLGSWVASVGDVDRDRAGDFLIEASTDIVLFSGKSMRVLASYPKTSGTRGCGGAGDLDRDGIPDFLFASNAYVNLPVEFYSGRTLKLIGTWVEPIGTLVLPRPVGDLDGDGWVDLLLSHPTFSRGSLTACGIAYAVSTKDFSVIRTWVGNRDWGLMGRDYAAAGDVDRDGYSDVVIGEPGNAAMGYVHIFSGRTGGLIRRIDPPIYEFGFSVDGGHDVNGDGTPDVLGFSLTHNLGVTQVWTHLDLPLSADVHELSVQKGGRQHYGLAAGPGNAGKWHLILGTFSDVKPGVQLGSLRLPLNPDPYLALTLQAPNAHIVPSLGVLDAQGRAQAILTLPPLPPTVIGTRLDHAYVVLQPSPLRFDLASNSVPLVLVK